MRKHSLLGSAKKIILYQQHYLPLLEVIQLCRKCARTFLHLEVQKGILYYHHERYFPLLEVLKKGYYHHHHHERTFLYLEVLKKVYRCITSMKVLFPLGNAQKILLYYVPVSSPYSLEKKCISHKHYPYWKYSEKIIVLPLSFSVSLGSAKRSMLRPLQHSRKCQKL